jgi:hypothetical protein
LKKGIRKVVAALCLVGMGAGIIGSGYTSEALVVSPKLISSMAKQHQEFSLVTYTELTSQEKIFVAKAKRHKGVFKSGNLVVISAGTKPTGGYGLIYVSQEKVGKTLNIYVKETKPEPGKLVTQALTNPHITGKVNNFKGTIRVFNVDTKKLIGVVKGE